MRTYDLKKIQNIELEILDEILRICNTYDLKYSLIGGSCLGAVRHHGFIPWDDDIDLGMPRVDYEKFCHICKKELDARFILQNYDTEPNCGLIFGKIRRKDTTLSEIYSHHIQMNQGVWVDIFPYDYVSDDMRQRKKDVKQLKWYQNLYIIQCGYKFPENHRSYLKIPYYLSKVFLLFLSKSFFIKRIKTIMMKYDINKTETIYPYGGVYTDDDFLPADSYDHVITVDFEGRQVNIYKEYDAYLKALYGNYMTLPPKEKRTSGGHSVYEFQDNRKERL